MAKKQIATEDIIVYKRIKIKEKGLKTQNIDSLHGKPFKGQISIYEVSGIISVESGYVFYCTDECHLQGRSVNDKFDYKYSWVHDNAVYSIIVDEEEIIGSYYYTPYRECVIEIGKTYSSNLIKNIDEVSVGLHSFSSITGAKDDGCGGVVKCIIPTGAEYYKGKFNEYDSYASNSLKYVEIINFTV